MSYTEQTETPYRFLLVNFSDGSFSTVAEDSVDIEEIQKQKSFQMMSCKDDSNGETMLFYWFEADPCDPEKIVSESEIVGRAMLLYRMKEGTLNDGVYGIGINVGDPANPPYDFHINVDE